jgi:hypothetical protein
MDTLQRRMASKTARSAIRALVKHYRLGGLPQKQALAAALRTVAKLIEPNGAKIKAQKLSEH